MRPEKERVPRVVVRECLLPVGEYLPEVREVPRIDGPPAVLLVEVERHVLVVEHHVQAVAGGTAVLLGLLCAGVDALPDGHHVVVGERLLDHLRDVLVDARPVGEVLAPHPTLGGVAVGQVRRLREEVEHVHPETVDALREPPVYHLVYLLANGLAVPVEVRLGLVEQVQVVRLAVVVPRPRRPAEAGLPVVRWDAPFGSGAVATTGYTGGLGLCRGRSDPAAPVGVDLAALVPPVVVGVLVVRLAGALEPDVFVGGVVDHEVHDESHVAVVHLGEQSVEVRHRAVLFENRPVVPDVVAVVLVGRVVQRVHPDDVHAQVVEVVQSFDDALDVPDAVAVRVVEALRVYLVDERLLPPGAVDVLSRGSV